VVDEGDKMKRKMIMLLISTAFFSLSITGCTEAERVNYNISQDADNFNQIRQLTVINCIKGDVLFQMTGKMSIIADVDDNQLEVLVEDEHGDYKKHFIGLSDNVTYVVEDITSDNIENYHYQLNFNPHMWLPVKPAYID
jgi:hypothetical protein